LPAAEARVELSSPGFGFLRGGTRPQAREGARPALAPRDLDLEAVERAIERVRRLRIRGVPRPGDIIERERAERARDRVGNPRRAQLASLGPRAHRSEEH